MSPSPTNTPPAAARRAAEAELRGLVVKFTPTQQPLIAATRRSLRKLLPTAHEVVYEYRDCFVISFSPTGHGYEGVLALRGGTNGVRLYFNSSKGLPDPEKLLQGSGNQARWIPLEDASSLRRPAVAALIAAALARNRVPFASAGRGSVVVRATTAGKARGKRSA